MRKIRVEDAVGQTLCHDMTAILADGFKGVKFPRGHVITEADIPELLNIGKAHIYVWEPEADEVHEDDAAIAVSKVLCDESIQISGPHEGKMQLTAAADGLFCVNGDALRAINQVPDYTIACRSNFTPVHTGDKLAGARIVPLVTKRSNVERAVALAVSNAPIFSVRPFRPLRCGLVITGSEIYHRRIPDKMEPIIVPKIKHLGGQYLHAIFCDDDIGMILGAIHQLREEGAELILLTGGMSVDPDDVTPTAIRSTGARVVTQGVPMQPGNMLTIAYCEDAVTLIGVPGASMHSPITSLDVFLPRVFAGVEITAEEIADFGLGGFCLNCPVCHFPNCNFGHH
jgi:hypothetical protein